MFAAAPGTPLGHGRPAPSSCTSGTSELVGVELRDRRAMLVHLVGKTQDRGFLTAEERQDDLFDDLRETLDPAALGLDLFEDGLDVERHRVVELLFE